MSEGFESGKKIAEPDIVPGKNYVPPKNRGTKTLFRNPILEKLSRTHISVPLTIFASYAIYLLYWSVSHTSLSAGSTIGLFFLGFISFTLVEYLVHRYVYHLSTHTEWRKRFQYKAHGVHHEFPRDKERLFMPPVPSMVIASLIFYLMYLAIGWNALAFFPGFLYEPAIGVATVYLPKWILLGRAQA